MNKRAFSVGYRKPILIENTDPRNDEINRYISKLGREVVLKNFDGTRKLASASLTAWNPEQPQTATLTPSTQSAIGETESYLITSTFTPSSEFVGSISYSISGEENLPPGLNLNTSTGVVSGTPISPLAQNAFTITGTDSFGTFANSILNLLILLKAAILPSTQIVYGEVDSPLSSVAFTPNSRFVGTVTYAISGGTLPAGLSFNTSTGVISGTPTETLSQTNFTVTASGVDAYSTSVSADADILLSVLVKAEITPATQTLLAVINEEITPTTAYTPNSRFDGIVTYALSGGVLPAGLSFDTSTGVISGMPLSALEETEFLVTASGVDTYDQSVSATATIDITVLDTPKITPETQTIMTLVDTLITPTVAYTPNIIFSGTVTYTLIPPVGRSLPTGLSFDTSTGVISGTPTTTLGTTVFTVQADDAFGTTANATITITVTSTVLVVGPEIINTPGLTDSVSTTTLNVNTINITDSILVINESDIASTENINVLSATASDSIAVAQPSDSAIAESISFVNTSASDNISTNNVNDSGPTAQLQ